MPSRTYGREPTCWWLPAMPKDLVLGAAARSACTGSLREAAGGKRLVQYFDKSRMEINNPNGDPTSPFYVTNGLLTVELIIGQDADGRQQLRGRASPAQIPLASDPDDPTRAHLCHSRASQHHWRDQPRPRHGQSVTATLTAPATWPTTQQGKRPGGHDRLLRAEHRAQHPAGHLGLPQPAAGPVIAERPDRHRAR